MSQEPPLKRHSCSQILASDHLLLPATKSSHFGWSLMGGLTDRVVIKRQGPGISLGYYESGPWLLSQESRRKIQPKEIPSCLIPHLFVVFTRQLEILVTSLVLRIFEDFCLTILLYPAFLSRSIPIETVSRPSSSALHMSRN